MALSKTITALGVAQPVRSLERARPRLPVFIFDFGGVVIKWKSNDPIFDSIAQRYRIPLVELRRAFEVALPRLESGEVSMREFLTDSLARFGKRLRKGDSPEELWTEPFARLAKLRLGTVKVVLSLRKRGYKVFLFSNTSLPHVRFLERVGWDRLFDGFLASCEMRALKPSPEAYAAVLERIKAAPSEVVFIDDKEANVRGAKDFGIRWSFRFTSLARLKRDIESVERDTLQEGDRRS
jgi:HAD superfamily hydrolase (TIGR01509 family)